MATMSASARPEEKAALKKRKQLPRKHQEAVYRATAHLLLEKGHRDLRTAEIADLAGITESTLFRTYGKLDELLAATDNWAWERVVRAVIDASFDRPHGDPRSALLADTDAVWRMRINPDDSLPATFAFLFFRRKHELDLTPSSNELRFTTRLNHHCELLVAPGGDSALLTTFVLNYIATVWLTWETMPRASYDTRGRDLRPDEVQFGVLMLLEEFGATQADTLTA